VFKEFAKHTDNNKYYGSLDRLLSLCKIVEPLSPGITRDTIKGSIRTDIRRLILSFPNLTVDEEELGLRDLSNTKYCPTAVLSAEYKPSLEAIKRLPSIMRLKCLETLVGSRFNAYNIFERITDPDEFKSLLFSCTIKHRDRAEQVWHKYQEITQLGVMATVAIEGECTQCKEFSITIKSRVVRTKAGLECTRLKYHIGTTRCPFCCSALNREATFKEVI
jgi:hypothetical protein